MGKEQVIYVWQFKVTDANHMLVFARAESASEAVEKIILKLARTNPDTGQIIKIEDRLRNSPPTLTTDFSEEVGLLSIDVAIQQ